MGVTGTYCLVCGLPVQHDHYVPTEREHFFAIYRHDNQPHGHFPFGPEHDWLLQAVGVSERDEPLFGRCEDGVLGNSEQEGYFVGDGWEDACAFHVYCWEGAGQPRHYGQVAPFQEHTQMAIAKPYQGQLFDFFQCSADGNSWILQDPNTEDGQQSRDRIDAILKSRPTL